MKITVNPEHDISRLRTEADEDHTVPSSAMENYNKSDFRAHFETDERERCWYCFAKEVETIHAELSKEDNLLLTSVGAEPDMIEGFNFLYEESKKKT